MIDDRPWIIPAYRYAAALLLRFWHAPRCVNPFVGHILQLGDVAPNELAQRVEFFRLRHRVENAKPRLRIAARGSRPLPAPIVRRQVVVDQAVGKPALTEPPVDPQILGQERRRHHAQAIVHIAAARHLPHRRVDQRVTCFPLVPRPQSLGPIVPDNGIVGRAKRAFDNMGEAVEDHEIEIAPDQFRQPGHAPLAADAQRMCHQFANRNGAEAQMYGKVRNPFYRRKVALLAVLWQAIAKIIKAGASP